MCYLCCSTCNTQFHLSIQSEIIQTFCTTRNYQHFCAPNLEVSNHTLYTFFSQENSVWPYVVFESVILALAWEGCPPYSMWLLALDSSLRNCLSNACPLP